MKFIPTELTGVIIIEPDVYEDERGWFMESFNQRKFEEGLQRLGLPLPDLAQPAWQHLFARVRALDWHVELHRESRDLAQAAQPVLDAGCKLVVDHFGRPGTQPTAADAGFNWLLTAADTGQVWVKLSAAYRNWLPAAAGPAAHDAAQALLKAFGAGRLLWGSDWPHTQHRETTCFEAAHAALSDWVHDANARRRILVDTPAQLFQFNQGDIHDQ